MIRFIFLLCFLLNFCHADVELGIDQFFQTTVCDSLKGKKVGLITNHTGVNQNLESTFDLFLHNNKGLILSAVFAPEHGFYGANLAEKEVQNEQIKGIPIYSLYGKIRRPTDEMLKGIDVLIYDVQDIGIRSYTYASTLFYVMEEAAKRKIPLIVLDRPNPLGGNTVDGPMLEEKFRSFIGYIDVPYCHGLTIGELACYFNQEYNICCQLKVIAMKGWKRNMLFEDTGLHWIPTSPYIPEPDTPFFYAMTGLIGQLSLVNIGIGYSLPFKIIGAPWIESELFAKKLNAQKFAGIRFVPFSFTPQFGLYKGELCNGVLIFLTDKKALSPVKIQHYILGILKSLYPSTVQKKLSCLSNAKKDLFFKAEGTDEIFYILCKEKYPAWKMMECNTGKTQNFLQKRKKYFIYN